MTVMIGWMNYMDIMHTSTPHILYGTPDLTNATDEALMRSVAQGDSNALSHLYDRHVRGCFGLAMKIVHDPWMAEEVVQDVFMKLWSRPLMFSPERGKFSGWLLAIVHNRSVDRLRRQKSAGANSNIPLDSESDLEGGGTLVDVVPDLTPGPYEQAWSHETGRIVRNDLEKLPEPQKQMLVMAYFDGLTQREIAEKLAQPIGTVKTRTRAALAHMRNMLVTQDLLGEVE